MGSREDAIRRYEEGDTWRDDDEVVEVAPPRKRPADKVVPVRLSADEWEKLRALAAEQGIGPSTLLRQIAQSALRDQVGALMGKTMKIERGQQYDRRQVAVEGEVYWIDFVEDRDMPENPEEVRRYGAITMTMSSRLNHTFRAIVRDRDNHELFTVEYVEYGPGAPMKRDMPLRQELARRLQAHDWKHGEVYDAAVAAR